MMPARSLRLEGTCRAYVTYNNSLAECADLCVGDIYTLRPTHPRTWRMRACMLCTYTSCVVFPYDFPVKYPHMPALLVCSSISAQSAKKSHAHTLREPFAFLSRAYVRDITEHIRVVVIHHTFLCAYFEIDSNQQFVASSYCYHFTVDDHMLLSESPTASLRMLASACGFLRYF